MLWINFLFLGINPIRIRYLIKPVKKGTFSVNRYKGIIDAKVPRMDNLEQKEHKNGFTQQNQNALTTRHSFFQVNALSQVLTRLTNGTSRITRYHQIRKIFMSDDTPIYKDNDFLHNYKTLPDRIVILYGNNNIFQNSANYIDEMTVDQSVPIKQLTYVLEPLPEDIDRSLKKVNLHLLRSGLTLETDTDTDTNILSVLASMLNENLENESHNLILNNEPKITSLYVIIMSRTSFRVNPHSIVCLNVKKLLARSRRHIWSLSYSNGNRFIYHQTVVY